MYDFYIDEGQVRQIKGMIAPKRPVLICAANPALTQSMASLVSECGAVSLIAGPDMRWMSLFRQAFSERVGTVIGEPYLILGLSKLARSMGMPLKIRKAILLGAPCDEWMAEGIRSGLDCSILNISCRGDDREKTIIDLERELLRWTSVLDCRLAKREYGLEMELVTFAGEKIPKLPSCARLVMRAWNPEEDYPMILGEKY